MTPINQVFLGRICFSMLFLGLAWGAVAAPVAIPIYGPTEAGINLDGDSEYRPFDLAQPARFQQVYGSSAFEVLAGVGGGSIAEISFRIDASLGHSFIANIPNLQLNLSTTSRNPDGLSPVFDDNVGIDNIVVLGPTRVQLSGAGGGGFTGFHVSFSFLDTPFYYNPANGNLLLDFRIYQGIGDVGVPQGVAILDAFNVVGDSVSSVYGFGLTLPTSGQVSSLGLATAIRVIPVPEPSTVTLLAVGLLFVGGMGWKRMKKHKEDGNVPA